MNLATSPTGFEAVPLDIETRRGGVGVIDALAPDWRRLCEAGPYDQPFYRPEWIRAYVAAFAPRAEVVVITLRDAGRLVAVLPLIREVSAIGGLPARKLRSAGNTHTCRFDLVHDVRQTESIVPRLWAALLGERGWDALELNDVPAGSALGSLIAHAAAAGYCTRVAPGLTPPYLDLRGGIEGVLECLDAKFRANLRRRMRKLESRGRVDTVRSDAAGDRLETFYMLERAGWKGAEGSAIACDSATRTFYCDIAEGGERAGTLALYALECGGRPVAMYFGVERGRRYYLLKTTYDENLRDCSPGQLLTHEVLRDLVARGCIELDLLGGMMEWKADWKPEVRALENLYVFRGAGGIALDAINFRIRPAIAKAVRRLRVAA